MPRKTITLYCQACNQPFEVEPAYGKRAKYCSKTCADPHRGPARQHVTIICAECQQPFDVPPYRAASAKYCSRACQSAASRPVAKTCTSCEEPFTVIPARAATARYCSKRCKDASLIGRAIFTRQPAEERFWSRVVKQPDGCWVWTAGKNFDGYGVYRPSKDIPKMTTHRYAWLITYGSIPEGEVCHTCDVKSCVNPAHLFIGSHTDNIRDASRKGIMLRSGAPMNEDIVRQIRALAGKVGPTELAQRFGTSKSNIWVIQNYRTWKEVV